MAQIILDVNTTKAVANLEQLKKQVTSIAKSLSSVKTNQDLTKQLNALSRTLNASARATETSAKADKLKAQAAKESAQAEKFKAQAAKEAAKAAEAVAKAEKEAAKAQKENTESKEKNTEGSKKLSEENENLKESTDDLTESMGLLDDVAKKSYDNVVKWIANAPGKLLKSFVNDLNETLVKTENTVVELKRVIQEDIDDQEISDTLYDLAEKYGQTFENASTAASNFAKSGKNWQETIKATEAALLSMNVAELTAEESSTGLIAVMNQFGYGTEDLTHIIDVLNKEADSAPVSTEKLLQGLQKAGSYAKQANMSLEETVAILTALSGATGASGQQIGTATKSLLAYTTKEGALDVYASLSGDMNKVVTEYKKGAASILDVWRQLSSELNHLTAEQADKLAEYAESEEGQAMETALGEELSEIYDSMTGVYDTAGTYRKNYFIALMKNFEDVNTALANVEDAEGYSQEENLLYMDTYTAKANALNAEWEKFLTSGKEALEFKKFLAELGTGILQLLNNIGGLRTASLALLSIVGTIYGYKLIDKAKTFFKTIGEGGKKIGDCAKAVWNLFKRTKELETAEKAQKTAAEAAAAAENARAAAMNGVIGIAGLAVTVISAVVGAIDSYNEQQRQARQEAIQTALAQEEDIKTLTSLYTKYQKLGSELKTYEGSTEGLKDKTDEYLGIEKELAGILDEKNTTLGNLTTGTDEYRKSLEELAKIELKGKLQTATAGRMAAEEKLSDVEIPSYSVNLKGFYYPYDAEAKRLEKYLSLKTRKGDPTLFKKVKGDNAYEILQNADSALSFFHTNGDFWEKNQAIYRDIVTSKNNAETAIKEYLQTAAEEKAIQVILSGEKDYSIDEIAKEIVGDAGFQKDDAYFEQFLKETLGYLSPYLTPTSGDKDDGEGGKDDDKKDKEFKDKILENIKKISENTEKMSTLEQKQNDVQEKQLALQEAEKQRTVRVYNQETGHWEMSANPKEVEAAKEALEKSKKSLADYAAEQAYNEISSMEDFSISDAMSIIYKWRDEIEGLADTEPLMKLKDNVWNAYDSAYLDKIKVESVNNIIGSKSSDNTFMDFVRSVVDKKTQNNTSVSYTITNVNGITIKDPDLAEELLELFSRLGMETGE
nr:MAG TPA: minor tail protein [Caudoviricetes sp.]